MFLAYASPDEQVARELYGALGAAGLSVCFDREVLRPGDDWHLLLPRYQSEATVTLALVSSHTEEAHYQRSEVIRAIEQTRREGGRLIPVRLEAAVEMPYGTEQLQAVDMFDRSSAPAVAERVADVVRNPQMVRPLPAVQVFCERVPAVPRFFAGREALLARLAAALDQDDGAATVLTQAISGMGGVGKTTLAAALVENHRHERDIVWWVRAEQPTVLAGDLAELATRVGLPSQPDDDLPALARALRRWLESTERRWLLVFDNAPDEASVEPWRPRRGHGTVVVTSRNRNFGRFGDVIEVDTFPPDVADRFLRDRVAPRNPGAAREDDVAGVVNRLDGLPLALEQAAAWVERVPNRTFTRYASLFDAAATDPFPEGTRPLGYGLTASNAWKVSIAAAEAEAPLAGRLLAALAFFASDDLPCQWLREAAGHPYLAEGGGDAAAVDAALDALHGYSLVRITPEDTVTVHRLIQGVTRPSAPSGAEAFAAHVLSAQLPDDVVDPANGPTLATMTPHALAFLRTTADRDLAPEVCEVLNTVTAYQVHNGLPPVAMDAATAVADFAAAQLGADHPATLRSRKNLADAHVATSDLRSAHSHHEAVLADRERVLGADHPDTLQSRSDFAHVDAGMGSVQGALAVFRATVADQERVVGPDHPDTLMSRQRLALAHSALGHHEQARELYTATLADRERVLGADHPHTLATRSNLAAVLNNTGSPEQAISLLEAVLDAYERQLGRDHGETLRARSNIAIAYSNTGDVERAIRLLESVVADCDRVLGPDHLQTVDCRRDLANAYVEAGQSARGVPILEDVVTTYEAVLGADHPSSWNARRELLLATGALEPLFSALDGLLPADPTAGAGPEQASVATGVTAFGVLLVVAAIGVNPDTALGPLGDPAGAAVVAVPVALAVIPVGLVAARYRWFRFLHGLVHGTVHGWSMGAILGLVAALVTGHAEMIPALALHLATSYAVFAILQRIRSARYP